MRLARYTMGNFSDFDYIVTMDESNFADVSSLLQKAQSSGDKQPRLVRLMDFAPNAGTREVPDPYHTGEYEAVYDLVEQATTGLLDEIRRENSLK